MIIAGNGIYARCADCGKLVKLNKWGIGSMHFCVSPEERAQRHEVTITQLTPEEVVRRGQGGLLCGGLGQDPVKALLAILEYSRKQSEAAKPSEPAKTTDDPCQDSRTDA